ncbi:hypothetical protein IA539_04505 [Gordonia sp. zg691]|uniref:Secreted protein n=1 Tax=Gordonia jinghuaiqii TaxID=2758710 RepID=A0A7D7LVG8_9ACTN|nr:hypothetical protein [Gordonia jinghuaiqii]MBD0860469.1 hypothetical protein [Gordonia jinghuaiqii]MCR5978261.1 hypothetical protein [Gordonia jinghuaiqii]QMT04060.1 hypothetical protein H1R19_21070 [Gordonia jinghuaiqii]
MAVGVATILTLAAGLLVSVAPAQAAEPAWNGVYTLKRFAASKTGTSLAARQGEPDFSDDYTFVTSCVGGACVATVTNGPKPANPTLPQPPRYIWENGSWVHRYSWEWDCWQGAGVPKVWAPAESEATYTPQADGTLTGLWRTTIKGGPCNGTVDMRVAAYPVNPSPVPLPGLGSLS